MYWIEAPDGLLGVVIVISRAVDAKIVWINQSYDDVEMGEELRNVANGCDKNMECLWRVDSQ